MMAMLSNHSSRIIHAWRKRGFPLGWLQGPRHFKNPLLPFALDNDAYTTWKQQKPWDECAYLDCLYHCRKHKLNPLWVLVPDVVADADATIAHWHQYSPAVRKYGWPLAFAVQDGMTPNDVPDDADVVFVGGTTGWKWRNAELFCKSFPRVHIGRVNTLDRLWICQKYGAESVDGTGWFRDGQNAWRFRKLEQFFLLKIQEPTLF